MAAAKPFDPVAEGGIPVTETSAPFDPAAEGGVPVQERPDMGNGEVALRGTLAGAGWGWAPELAGVGGWLTSMAGGGPGPALDLDAASKEYAQVRDYERAAHQRADESNPMLYGATKVAGSMPAAMAAGGSASAAQRVANMGILGGIQGAGDSRADTAEGVLGDAATGAAIGMGGQYLGDKLFGWLGSKLGHKADERQLVEAGFTRQQHRNLARRMGDVDGYETRLEEIVDAAKRHGIGGHSPWEKAGEAIAEAKQTIGGQYAQAAANHPGAPGLSMNDILRARAAAADGVSSSLGERALGKVDDEVRVLLGKLSNGELGPVEAHKWALDLKSRLFPASGAPVSEGVDPQMMMRFRQQLVESMRSRARAMHPAGADAFEQAVREYGPLSDLERAARQGLTRDHSGHSPWATLGHNWHIAAGLGSLGLGGALGHHEMGAAAGLGTMAAGAVSHSPALMRAGQTALTSQLSGGLGRATLARFPRLVGMFYGQEKAAEEFKDGGDIGADYTPHTPVH